MNSLTIDIPAALVPHAESAVARLGYLHSGVEWALDADGMRLIARYAPERHTPERLREEALFQLYREKIHHDTLGIRTRIYEAI